MITVDAMAAIPGAGDLMAGDRLLAIILRVQRLGRSYSILCRVGRCKHVTTSQKVAVRHLRKAHDIEGEITWKRF